MPQFAPRPPKVPVRLVTNYALTLIVTAASFLLILEWGENTVGGPVPVSANPSTSFSDSHFGLLPRVLGAMVVIVAVARIVGMFFRQIGQSRVVGEVVAGIVLGPSILGKLAPELMASIFPDLIAPSLEIISQLGVVLYLFLVGVDLNAGLLKSNARLTATISNTSIIVPFLMGVGLAIWLFPRYAPLGVSFTTFSLFLGVAMAITAFPVLARILTDQKIEQTTLGVISLSCAAANDVSAWCLLAVIVGVARADYSNAIWTIFLAFAYALFMLAIVRPLMAQRFSTADKGKPPSNAATAWVFVAVLASAFVTEAIGIHAIFGAFLLGVIIPHDSVAARAFRHKLEDIVTILLLPVFFAYTGLRTEIGLLSEPADWLACALITLVATIGKFGGTWLAALYCGVDRRMSIALGVLMNTRGLMELIVLNVGRDLGIISPKLFAMLVLMAVITTFATTPLLRLATRSLKLEESTFDRAVLNTSD